MDKSFPHRKAFGAIFGSCSNVKTLSNSDRTAATAGLARVSFAIASLTVAYLYSFFVLL